MEREKISIAMLAVFSAIMLAYRSMSLLNIMDYVILFYSGLFAASICFLLIKK